MNLWVTTVYKHSDPNDEKFFFVFAYFTVAWLYFCMVAYAMVAT